MSVLEPVTQVFLRANGYSLATALGASVGVDPGERAGRLFAARSSAARRRLRPSSRPRRCSPALAALVLRRRDVV